MFYALIPIALMFVGMGSALIAIYYWRYRYRKYRRSPLTEKLLRGPGTTLRQEMEEIDSDMDIAVMLIAFGPTLIFSVHVGQSYFATEPESLGRTSVAIVTGIALLIFGIVKLVMWSKRKLELRCGLDAEIAIGQELDQLMREGAVVFHDFPAEQFNIDHVVLTRGGVFAVETKGRMKPQKGRGTSDAKVECDGQVLKFPDWVEKKPVEQARRQAKWLGEWLSSAVGDQMGAKPVLALPGWYVERSGRSDVWIINGKEAKALLKGWQGETFSDSTMQRISHQLEQRCRDVEPVFYRRKRFR